MSNLCNKYLSVKRNEDRDYLEFTIEDIAKPPLPPTGHHSKPKDDDGFDIHRKNNTYLEDRILISLVNEGLIEVVSDEMYRLTEEGKKYCKRLDQSIA
jgi:hypothetical protein